MAQNNLKEGGLMATRILRSSVLGVLLLSVGLIGSSARGNAGAAVQTARVEFLREVAVMGVLLKGEYLVVHDENKVAAGQPCTYIYRTKDGSADKLVVSFHCQRQARTPSENFKIRVGSVGWPQVQRIEEIQFAGSPDGHRVPAQ